MSAPRQHGFSLLELVVVVILISILWFVAIDQLLKLRVDAERVAMERVLGTLKSALGIEVAGRVVKQGIPSIAELDGSNPMDRLAELPKNYIGELDGPDPAAIEGGQWYFDTRNRILVYRVDNAEYFETPLPGPARARFRVQVLYTDRNGNGRLDPPTDDIGGVRLAPLEPYRWKREPE